MNTAEAIKAAREQAGMTQEALAERLDVSRQAVSKWEMGLSSPSPENLALLSEILSVDFSSPEGPPPPHRNPWRTAALALGSLCVLLAVVFGGILTQSAGNAETAITGIYFFDETGKELHPDKGDGWNLFPPDSRVWMAVTYQEDPDRSVCAVSLFLTPTGTETFDQRQQLAVQATGDARGFALFPLDVSPDLMGHLEVVLECAGDRRVTEELKIGADLLA